MFKKTISVVLALMMLFTMFVLPSSAADATENLEAYYSELLGADAQLDEALVEAILDDAGANPTKADLADAVSNYAVVAAEDVNSVEALAEAIAQDSVYTIKTLENGKQTIYIAVDVANHPELFDMEVFRAAVYKICDRQQEFVTDEADFDLLTYARFAGELYVHMRIYQFADPLSIVLGPIFDYINKIVEMTAIADMNIDESRFPGFLFDIIGGLLLR